MGVAGKRRASKGSHGGAARAGARSSPAKGRPGPTHWKAVAAWVGALVTAVVTAVVVTFVTHFSQHVVTAGGSAPPEGAPIAIQHVSAAPVSGDSFAFPEPLNISPVQLQAFDSTSRGYMPGWVGLNQNYPWAWAHGGAAVTGIAITLDLRGNRKSPVRIQGMQLAEQCRTPAVGTLFYSPSAGGGHVIKMGFNLDKVHPIAQMDNGGGAGFGKPYFSEETITLAHGEKQQLQVGASTQQHYCAFRIDMAVLAGNRIVHELIGNGKQPFRVTAAPTAPDPILRGQRTIKYRAYQRVYVGGVASDTVGCSTKWVGVDPATYSLISKTHIGAC
jgi:hypothetical protein